jgi:hypothetical protein
MIALLKIQCPHCSATGQVLMPPPGALIIGPCPECAKLVVIFAGDAMPLDDEIMRNRTIKDKYEHVMAVLSSYVEKKVRQCFSQPQPTPAAGQAKQRKRAENPTTPPISDSELEEFVQHELGNLDDPEFFKHLND